MPKIDLLPGVITDRGTPAATCDTDLIIRRARSRTNTRHVVQLALLAGLDIFCFRWKAAQLPLLDRQDSLLLLAILNGLLVTALVTARLFPRWRAKRIAKTWSDSERHRFRT